MQYNRLTSDTSIIDYLKKLDRKIDAQATKGSGDIIISDPNTGVETIIGTLPDGTSGILPFVGDTEPPPVPTAPIVSAQPGQMVVTWDGLFVAGATQPRDFVHVNIIGHKMNGTATVLSSPVGILRLSADSAIITSDVIIPGEVWQFSLQSEDYNGNRSVEGLRSASFTMKDAISSVDAAWNNLNADVAAAQTSANNAQTSANNAQTSADSAASIANSKGKVLTQSTVPAAADQNSTTLWIDTTNGANTPKRWDGTAWVAVTDKVAVDAANAAATAQTRADQAYNEAVSASTAAGNAQTTADGKNRVWYQTTPPAGTGHKTGDTWFDTDDGNKIYLWTGTAWAVFQDTAIAAAQSTADSAQTSANGKNTIYYQTAQPTGGTYKTGDTWFDIDDNYKMYTYSGSTWVLTQDSAGAVTTSEKYVQSRGMDLVTNGNGQLLSNKNFSPFTYNQTDTPTGAIGVFDYPLGASSMLSDEYMRIDPAKSYQFRVTAKQKTAGVITSAFTGVAPYDPSGLLISPTHYMEQANTRTTLAAALNPGATTITLTSAANWNNAGGAANTHLRSMIVWNYVDSTGKLWAPGTYSRNYYGDLWNEGSISGNVITLKTPWAGPAIPSGTTVGNGSSAGTYMYVAMSNTTVPETWTTYSGTLSGVHTDLTRGATTKFPAATASVRLVFLGNRVVGSNPTTDSKHSFANISLSEVSAANLEVGGITESLIGPGAVTSVKIASAAITDAKIQSLDAGKITTGTVDANRIGANTITADKILVGDFTNLASDGNFTDLTKKSWSGSGTVVTETNTPNKLKVVTASSGNNDQPNVNTFQVLASEQIYGEVWVYGEAANVGGGVINMHLAIKLNDGTTVWPYFNSTTRAAVSGQWVKLSGTITIPSNAKTAVVQLAINYSADAVGNIYYFREISVRRKASGSLIVDGAITTSHMTAGTIDASVLTAGSITAPKIAAKTITTDKLVISSSDNLILEADFSNGGSSWELGTNKTINATAGRGSLPAFRVTGTAVQQTSKNLVNKIPVGTEDRFRCSMWVKSTAALAAGSVKLGIRCYTTATAYTDIFAAPNDLLVANTWTNLSGIAPALPAGTIAAEFFTSVTNDATGTITDIDYVSVTRASDGNLIVDGAIDGKIITGATIQTAQSPNARVMMDSTGLHAWDSANFKYLTADSSGITLDGLVKSTGKGSWAGNPMDVIVAMGDTVQTSGNVSISSWPPPDDNLTRPGIAFVPTDGRTVNRYAGFSSEDSEELEITGGLSNLSGLNMDPGYVRLSPGKAEIGASNTTIFADTEVYMLTVRTRTWGELVVGGNTTLNGTLNGVSMDATTKSGVTFTNGWTNFGSGYGQLQVKEIVPGVVLLQGMVKPGTKSDGIAFATIPTEFRPNVIHNIATNIRTTLAAPNQNEAALLQVNSNGNLHLFANNMASCVYATISVTYYLSSP